MAIQFITGSEINLELEYLINDAEDHLYLICPFIKLHDKLKKELKSKKEQDGLKIVVVFGKNEEGLHKSLSQEDFDFLKDFPNIEIKYERKLHAKYYANQERAIVTSMNLYEASHNNNIEVGILMDVKGVLAGLGDIILQKDDPELKAHNYFEKVIKNARQMYLREPNYKKTLMGLSSEYIGSETKHNELEDVYKDLKPKPIGYKVFETETKTEGFCIRTGVSIPFNLKQPYSESAFRTWKSFSNPDYPEKYCHFSGEKCDGETSFKSPILRKNWKLAKSRFGF